MGKIQRLVCFGIVAFSLTLFMGITSSTFAAEKTEILIGANLPVTGPSAMLGVEHRWGYEQAVADINAKGGIFVKEFGKKLPVKLIVQDDEGDPGKAAAAVERLIKIEKVDLLLSTHNTAIVIPSCGTAEKYKRYYHATAGLIPVWQGQKFNWSTMLFLDWTKYAAHPYEIWEKLPEKIKNPAMLMEDTIDGRGLGGMIREAGKAFNVKFVVDEPWAVGAKDYSSQILKLKAKKVDSLFLFGSPADSVTFIRQMKEVNYGIKHLHGYKGTWNTEFWDALDKDAQYILFDGFWHEDYPFPGAKELGAKYRKKYGRPSLSIGLWYATAQTLFMAIEKAGTLDNAKVRDTVINNEFKGTVLGDIKYNADGSAGSPILAGQWWNGEQKLVYPFFEGAWKPKMAPPWNER